MRVWVERHRLRAVLGLVTVADGSEGCVTNASEKPRSAVIGSTHHLWRRMRKYSSGLILTVAPRLLRAPDT